MKGSGAVRDVFYSSRNPFLIHPLPTICHGISRPIPKGYGFLYGANEGWEAGRRGFDEGAFRLEWKTERTARTAPLPFTHPKDYLHHQFLTAPENEIIQRRKISRPLSKGYPILLIFCFIHVFTCI